MGGLPVTTGAGRTQRSTQEAQRSTLGSLGKEEEGKGEARAVRMYGEPGRHIVSVSRKAKGAWETVYQANS